jgi:hypothetical protein
MKYGKPQTDPTAATPSPKTFGDLIQPLDIVRGQSQMPPVTSRQGRAQMRLGSEQPHAENHIVPPMPAVVPDMSQIQFPKPLQPVSCYPCISRHELITI